jgi:hypothetical protein
MKQRGKQEPLDGTDPLLVTMKKYGIPLTRRNYLEMNYPDGFPDPWTAELEDGVPDQFRRPVQEDGTLVLD